MSDLIENFIRKQHKAIPELEDDALVSYYRKCKSVRSRLDKIRKTLSEHGFDHEKSAKLALQLLEVPPGTKSHVRGNLFNDIISREISAILRKLKLDADFQKEKRHPFFHEIPDWIVTKKGKTLVGYNQISLFGGGHQLNRASKYVMDDKFHAKLSKRRIKMICVVRDVPRLRSGKSFEILSKGIAKRRIYCMKGLKSLINEYFCR